jgi:divalent metal cation (Fe/Co/Zn/Cd) transporter
MYIPIHFSNKHTILKYQIFEILGLLWNSASLLADAVHSLSDLISDLVTLIAYKKARTQKDEKFPYGYGTSIHESETLQSSQFLTHVYVL